MPNFIPGLELSGLFFSEAVKPILDSGFPGLRYSAALIHVTDPAVRAVAARRPIGSLEQFSDSTDLVSHAAWGPALRKLYE